MLVQSKVLLPVQVMGNMLPRTSIEACMISHTQLRQLLQYLAGLQKHHSMDATNTLR
jgi:hypothetical protein